MTQKQMWRVTAQVTRDNGDVYEEVHDTDAYNIQLACLDVGTSVVMAYHTVPNTQVMVVKAELLAHARASREG